MLFCRLDFFKSKLIPKNLSGIPSECQKDQTQIRPEILSGLIWVQTVCKGYQQMTKVAIAGKELRVAFVIGTHLSGNPVFC